MASAFPSHARPVARRGRRLIDCRTVGAVADLVAARARGNDGETFHGGGAHDIVLGVAACSSKTGTTLQGLGVKATGAPNRSGQ
jgi:hypothetical protein